MLRKIQEDIWLEYSSKTVLITSLGILLFGIYIGVLVYGKNSLTVLEKLKDKNHKLTIEKRQLKIKNQKLQIEFFELKQLEPKE